jgi:hypothetical protein
MEVKIRFNTNYPAKSDKKWRVIMDGVEELHKEVELLCNSYTTTEMVLTEEGVLAEKHHISCKPKGYSIIGDKIVFQ